MGIFCVLNWLEARERYCVTTYCVEDQCLERSPRCVDSFARTEFFRDVAQSAEEPSVVGMCAAPADHCDSVGFFSRTGTFPSEMLIYSTGASPSPRVLADLQCFCAFSS